MSSPSLLGTIVGSAILEMKSQKAYCSARSNDLTLGGQCCLPPTDAVSGLEGQGEISSRDLENLMQMIESFVVRRAVCNVATNRLRGIFGRMAGQIDTSDFVASSGDYLLGNHWPTDNEFKHAFAGFHVYSRRLARTRLILESLEESFGHKESPEITEDITVEHVMPQSLTTEWAEMLGPHAVDIHSQWLHTPGNLTLTGYNPGIGKCFLLQEEGVVGKCEVFVDSRDSQL